MDDILNSVKLDWHLIHSALLRDNIQTNTERYAHSIPCIKLMFDSLCAAVLSEFAQSHGKHNLMRPPI